MLTSQARAALVTTSFELAAARCEDMTPLVYARLFRDYPETEPLFRRDSNLAKGEMLALAIEAVLDFVGERRYCGRLIQSEVQSHEAYGTSPDLFRVFFGVVAATMRELVGRDWTPEIDAAWDDLLAELDYYVTHPNESAAKPSAALG
jgi:hemoglobin-like flavoprotein